MHGIQSIKPKDNLSVLKIMKEKDSSRALRWTVTPYVFTEHKWRSVSQVWWICSLRGFREPPPHYDAGTCAVGQPR